MEQVEGVPIRTLVPGIWVTPMDNLKERGKRRFLTKSESVYYQTRFISCHPQVLQFVAVFIALKMLRKICQN